MTPRNPREDSIRARAERVGELIRTASHTPCDICKRCEETIESEIRLAVNQAVCEAELKAVERCEQVRIEAMRSAMKEAFEEAAKIPEAAISNDQHVLAVCKEIARQIRAKASTVQDTKELDNSREEMKD